MMRDLLSVIPRSSRGVYTVNVDGVINGGTSSAVGVTLSGLSAGASYALTMPSGLTYTAWNKNNALNRWSHDVTVTAGGVDTLYGTTLEYANAEAARAAFPGATITGHTSYTFWINDTPSSDNAGGLSIVVTKL